MEILKINIEQKEEIEIFVEFPIYILNSYKGQDNLDEVWDDNIMYFINDSLLMGGYFIKESEILELKETRAYQEKLSYRMIITTQSTFIDFSCIVDRLTKENFQKGLCIKIRERDEKLNILFFDGYCADVI